jgi:glycosyltransferase involved in cell wall biosynthesis
MDDKKNIKICIISNIRSAHVIRWVKILSLKGYKISVITNESNKFNIPDVQVIECLSKKSKFLINHYVYELFRSLRIRSILRKINPDIVHIHSFDYIHPLMIGLVNYFLKGFRNLIISTWGTDVIGSEGIQSTWRGRSSKKLLLAQAKEITATTHFLAKATLKLTPKNKHVHVIPFGIDCQTFSRSKRDIIKPNIIRLGFIKHLKAKYGPDYLLKAMPLILKNFPETILIMVGQGEMEDDLKKICAHLDIKKNVQFAGFIEYKSVPTILEDIDIFVMPSIEDSETFGVAAIEAQSMEIPVVASDVGGVAEAVLDGETGLLVEPKNIVQLANAIIKLIEDPDLRKQMGKKGRQFVLDNFRIEDNVLLFENLYKRLLKFQ